MPVKMDKIKASILLIGLQKEDRRMYPHLYDFLQNLRDTYDDVIYIGESDQSVELSLIDQDIKRIKDDLNIRHFMRLLYGLFRLLKDSRLYVSRHCRTIKEIKKAKFKHDKALVLAIDNYAFFFAQKYFPTKVILWSYDILTEDRPIRIKGGFLEKLLTAKGMKAIALIIQDEQRKKLLEESMGITFSNTIYLPVSLNDSEFCRKAAEERRRRNSFPTVNIIQNGWIAENRWSDRLIDAYQNWPGSYILHLHGFMGDWMEGKILKARRMPHVSTLLYSNDSLPQMLDDYDIGFVGYAEEDSNFEHNENASSQLVDFLRLGIPVIGCGSFSFNEFVAKQNIGISISSMEETADVIKKIVDNYALFSSSARKVYEQRFNLNAHFNNLIGSFQSLLK